jgi:succinate dehydrogenase / fumarate reductase iron-sulfur subunit
MRSLCGSLPQYLSNAICISKVSHLALLPQGDPERKIRAVGMIEQMDKEGFGSCTNIGACEAECPKGISLENIARLNREYVSAVFSGSKQEA